MNIISLYYGKELLYISLESRNEMIGVIQYIEGVRNATSLRNAGVLGTVIT